MDSVWIHIQTNITSRSPNLKSSVCSLLTLPSCSLHDRSIVIQNVLTLLTSTSPTTTSLHRLTMYQHLVWERLNTGHWAEVWKGWRDLYGLITVARVLAVAKLCEEEEVVVAENKLVGDVIRLCDLGIMLGGPVMGGVLEEIAEYLTEMVNRVSGDIKKDVKSSDGLKYANETGDAFPQKKLKLSAISSLSACPDISTISLKLPLPLLPIPVISSPSLPTFLTQCKLPLTTTLLRDCMTDWPCMTGSTRWSCDRLVQLAGPRTVPVELGSKYTDNSWTQQLLTVERFVAKYMMEKNTKVGYLAQHQLLEQVPALGRDIMTPDYCYTGEEEDEPDINVWIGPGGTVSPAHTDKKHNLLCQVVGTKYVALFYPEQGDKLYPHPSPMLTNTSMVDLDSPDMSKYPLLGKLQGYHTLLREGEMLYIPPLVWHYVRSLEQSFSVSFWWE